MSGETEKDESAFTTDTLRYLMNQRFADLIDRLDDRQRAAEKLLDERKSEQDKNIDKALASVDKRLESMNEFRATLSDQAAKFIPRQEYDSAHEALVQTVNDLKDRINTQQGQGIGKNQMWAYFAGAVGVLATIVVLANAVFSRG